MSSQTWRETLMWANAAGATLSSFTTAASLLPSTAKYTLPANWLRVGSQLRIWAAGQISNVVTAQPTFTFSTNFGSTSVFSGGALTTSTTAHTTVPWTLEIVLTCRATGSGTAANLMGQGTISSQAFVASGATADSANTHTVLMLPNSTPAVGNGFDSTVSNVVDFLVACGTSNASNAVTLHQYSLESLN